MRTRTFLSRRSLGEGACSMKITEDIRKYAAEHGLTNEAAIESGMQEKKKEFLESGSEVYAKP
jgi:phosphomethylpyrimidine synthase